LNIFIREGKGGDEEGKRKPPEKNRKKKGTVTWEEGNFFIIFSAREGVDAGEKVADIVREP